MPNLLVSFSIPLLISFILTAFSTVVLSMSKSEFGEIIDYYNKATEEKHLSVIPFHVRNSKEF